MHVCVRRVFKAGTPSEASRPLVPEQIGPLSASISPNSYEDLGSLTELSIIEIRGN